MQLSNLAMMNLKNAVPDMLSTEQIRTHLDALGFYSRMDDEGDLVVSLRADSDYANTIIVCVMVEHEMRLSFVASTPDYHPTGDLLFLANRHNRRHYMPAAVVRDGKLRMEYSYLITEEVSDDFLRYDCIQNIIRCIRNSFINLEKD